ncbi:hypothetical protein T492DRAFT_1144043 [Pavlovales sp. CCMP2436]|nr:hypothetical protein T492DRAFT_1144043 [Pavlovales sp. CCMP2436]
MRVSVLARHIFERECNIRRLFLESVHILDDAVADHVVEQRVLGRELHVAVVDDEVRAYEASLVGVDQYAIEVSGENAPLRRMRRSSAAANIPSSTSPSHIPSTKRRTPPAPAMRKPASSRSTNWITPWFGEKHAAIEHGVRFEGLSNQSGVSTVEAHLHQYFQVTLQSARSLRRRRAAFGIRASSADVVLSYSDLGSERRSSTHTSVFFNLYRGVVACVFASFALEAANEFANNRALDALIVNGLLTFLCAAHWRLAITVRSAIGTSVAHTSNRHIRQDMTGLAGDRRLEHPRGAAKTARPPGRGPAAGGTGSRRLPIAFSHIDRAHIKNTGIEVRTNEYVQQQQRVMTHHLNTRVALLPYFDDLNMIETTPPSSPPSAPSAPTLDETQLAVDIAKFYAERDVILAAVNAKFIAVQQEEQERWLKELRQLRASWDAASTNQIKSNMKVQLEAREKDRLFLNLFNNTVDDICKRQKL